MLEEYREFTRSTAKYHSADAYEYTILGLCSEAGEVAGKYKKFLRDHTSYEQLVVDITKELGDVMWYVDRVADEFEISLTDIIEGNISKLSGRMDAGTIGGSGDER